MADSFGKKTHYSSVFHLLEHWKTIWQHEEINEGIDLRTSIALLKDHPEDLGDSRSRDAFVRRFFLWLSLPKADREVYPIALLAGKDSLALRQCLWIDYVFGTAKALEAIRGLYREVTRSQGELVVFGPRFESMFFAWISKGVDNTSRGPLARWLKEARLGSDLATIKANESTVVVEMRRHGEIAPQALAYGLCLGDSQFSSTVDTTFEYSLNDLKWTNTAVSLFLSNEPLDLTLKSALSSGYLAQSNDGIRIYANMRNLSNSMVKGKHQISA
jgi:hypothetical protein